MAEDRTKDVTFYFLFSLVICTILADSGLPVSYPQAAQMDNFHPAPTILLEYCHMSET